jgi:hypothetical protein
MFLHRSSTEENQHLSFGLTLVLVFIYSDFVFFLVSLLKFITSFQFYLSVDTSILRDEFYNF